MGSIGRSKSFSCQITLLLFAVCSKIETKCFKRLPLTRTIIRSVEPHLIITKATDPIPPDLIRGFLQTQQWTKGIAILNPIQAYILPFYTFSYEGLINI